MHTRRCAVIENVLGPEASYLRRLGALCALLCGACAVLGLVLVAVRPSVDHLVATVCALAMALAGMVLARRS